MASAPSASSNSPSITHMASCPSLNLPTISSNEPKMKTSEMETTEFATVPAVQREAASSGVSWGAVMGGAFVTAALSLIMLALGAGFGLSTMSPWSREGASSAIGAAAIVWLIVTQFIASAMGGYLTGRLRVKWSSIHGDEVHFRDTANGFLTWAVALVMTVAFLTTAAATMAGDVAVASENRDEIGRA